MKPLCAVSWLSGIARGCGRSGPPRFGGRAVSPGGIISTINSIIKERQGQGAQGGSDAWSSGNYSSSDSSRTP